MYTCIAITENLHINILTMANLTELKTILTRMYVAIDEKCRKNLFRGSFFAEL